MSWHDDEGDFISAKNTVMTSSIPQTDKETIIELVDKLLATRIKKRRAIKYYYSLNALIERGYLKTYQGISEQELYKTLGGIETCQNFGPNAKRDYKVSLKRMLEHLHNPCASVIKTAEKQQYLPRFFLTIHDILKMVKSDWPHLRDKAIVSCLYESNCRPHEFFLLDVPDIRFETLPVKIRNGNTIVNGSAELAYLKLPDEGKTGPRNPPLIFSVPWLKAWLQSSVQPGSGDQRSTQDRKKPRPLWTDLNGTSRLKYPAALKAVKSLAFHAGIKKWDEVTLYTARHGMNTYLSQILTSAQQCEHAGWIQGSDMPRVYNHLSGTNMASPILAHFGIFVDKASDERQAWLELMKLGARTSKGGKGG